LALPRGGAGGTAGGSVVRAPQD